MAADGAVGAAFSIAAIAAAGALTNLPSNADTSHRHDCPWRTSVPGHRRRRRRQRERLAVARPALFPRQSISVRILRR